MVFTATVSKLLMDYKAKANFTDERIFNEAGISEGPHDAGDYMISQAICIKTDMNANDETSGIRRDSQLLRFNVY